MAAAPIDEPMHAIEAAALDYYEGWFDGESSRRERALHPDLVKRSLADDGSSVDTISAREMIEATGAGIGRTRDPGVERRRIEVRVDHVHGDIAAVTVTSAVYVDYLQLVRTREGWKIANVLWDRVTSEG
jgi:hypothetical protein